MGTDSRYPQRMPRSPWSPSGEQAELLAALRKAADERDRALRALDADVRAKLAACADADIPIARLAEELKVERKTIYRHLGRPMK